jgi:DNA-binding MarR family transcriptional regulator
MNGPGSTGVRAAGAGDTVVFALLHAAHILEGRLESALETVGLSLAKYGVLTHLAEAGEPISLSLLAARQSCVRSNMTQLVDRLEADGLVRRVADPADRRVVLADLTPLGTERQVAGTERLEREQSTVINSLSDQDRAALELALAAIK